MIATFLIIKFIQTRICAKSLLSDRIVNIGIVEWILKSHCEILSRKEWTYTLMTLKLLSYKSYYFSFQALTFQNDVFMLDCIIVVKLPQFEYVFRNLNSILISNSNYSATNSLVSAQRNYVSLSFAYYKDSILNNKKYSCVLNAE